MPDDIIPWVAIGVAAHAESEASEARAAADRAEAIARVRGFVNDTATVEERQQYAEAVRVLYPVERHHKPMPREQRVALGFAILAWLAVTVFGAVWRSRNRDAFQGVPDAALGGGMVAAIGAPIVCFVIFAVAMIIYTPFHLIFGP